MAASELPTSNVARLLGLRRIQGFESIELHDAAALLAAMTERTAARGSRLASGGVPLEACIIVLEGSVEVTTSAGRRSRVGANTLVGFLETLAESPVGLGIECASDVVLLEIQRAELWALLADRFDMLEGVLRGISAAIVRAVAFEVTVGRGSPTWRGSSATFTERLLFVHQDWFDAASVDTLAEFVGHLAERRHDAGSVQPAGSVFTRVGIVVAGSVEYGATTMGPGAIFGWLQCIAESKLAFDLVARPGTVTLEAGIDVVLDLFEDDVPLVLQQVKGLAKGLLEASTTQGLHEEPAPVSSWSYDAPASRAAATPPSSTRR